MSDALTILNLREQSAYQRTEIDSLKSRVRLLETQELPFISIDGPVSNAQLAEMPALTIKGNNLGSTGPAKDLTAAETVSMLTGQVATWSLTTINNTTLNSNQVNTGVVRRTTGSIQLQPGSGGTAATMLELTTTGATLSDQLTIDQSNTGRNGVVVNMPSGATGYAYIGRYNSSDALLFWITGTRNQINFPARNMGNDQQGSGIVLGRNTNAGAAGPAPGHIYMMRANGNACVIYPDNSNVLRVHNAVPTGSTGSPTVDITAGTVVGTQTSHYLEKRILGPAISPAEALANILAAASMVEEFEYLSGAFGFERFSGLVLRGSVLHRYGMDADEWHPAGRSLNVVNLHGDTVLAITELARRLAIVEASLGLA